jgi:hypothetical protein
LAQNGPILSHGIPIFFRAVGGPVLRRASHADKRRAWRRALLGEEIRAVLRPRVTEEDIQATAERLLSLAAWHE